MVAAFFSTPSGLQFLISRFLQMPLGLLVMEQSSRVTGFQVHGSHHRSLSLSSTRNFSLSSWQLTSGVPSGPPNGSTSYQITAQWWTFCGLALQEPPTIMSLVRFLSLLAARHSFSFTASPVRGKSNPIADSLSRFQFQRFRRLAPLADSIPTQIPQQLLSDLDLRCQINTTSI